MTQNSLSDIARWDDDGGAPIGHFEFITRGESKSPPRPAKPAKPARVT